MPSILEWYCQIRHIKSLDDMWRARMGGCVCLCLCLCDKEDTELYLRRVKKPIWLLPRKRVRTTTQIPLDRSSRTQTPPRIPTCTRQSFRLFWPSACCVCRANNLDKQCRREILRRYLPLHTFGAYSCVFAEFCRSAFQCKIVVDRCKPWVINTTHMDRLGWKHRAVHSSVEENHVPRAFMRWTDGWLVSLWVENIVFFLREKWTLFFHPLASIWGFFEQW